MKRQHFLGLCVVAGSLVGMGARDGRAERKGLTEGQPAVRHRMLLVSSRLEVSPAFEASLNAEFKHTVSGGLKLEYHFSDMFSAGAVGLFGTGINTGLTKRIVDTLPMTSSDDDPTPSRAQYQEHLNTIPLHGAIYGAVTPWYGKLAAFGKFFVNFDFYFQAGVSFAQLKNKCCTSDFGVIDENPGGNPNSDPVIAPDNNPNNDAPINDGTRVGLYLGGGLHVFVNNWIAIDFTVRDYAFSDNPSGLDFTADLAVKEDDNRFLNHLFMGVGTSFFFPGSG